MISEGALEDFFSNCELLQLSGSQKEALDSSLKLAELSLTN